MQSRTVRKHCFFVFSLGVELLILVAVVTFFVTHDDAVISTHTRSMEPTSPSLLRRLKKIRGSEGIPLCRETANVLNTTITVNVTPVTYREVAQEVMALGLRHGGRYAPNGCTSREKTAVIIPYRDRKKNLLILLRNLIPFLIKQNMEFRIFVIEQVALYDFNKGVLLNIGVLEAMVFDDFQCIVFHDTDFIPKDLRNLYRCGPQPRHLVVNRSDSYLHGLAYPRFFGGAFVATVRQWQSINGASNLYWAWGAEDDDIYFRFLAEGYVVERYPFTVGAYLSLGHAQQQRSELSRRKQLLANSTRRMWRDGTNTVNYEIDARLPQALYTWYLVRPLTPPPPPTPPPPLESQTTSTSAPTPTPSTPSKTTTFPHLQTQATSSSPSTSSTSLISSATTSSPATQRPATSSTPMPPPPSPPPTQLPPSSPSPPLQPTTTTLNFASSSSSTYRTVTPILNPFTSPRAAATTAFSNRAAATAASTASVAAAASTASVAAASTASAAAASTASVAAASTASVAAAIASTASAAAASTASVAAAAASTASAAAASTASVAAAAASAASAAAASTASAAAASTASVAASTASAAAAASTPSSYVAALSHTGSASSARVITANHVAGEPTRTSTSTATSLARIAASAAYAAVATAYATASTVSRYVAAPPHAGSAYSASVPSAYGGAGEPSRSSTSIATSLASITASAAYAAVSTASSFAAAPPHAGSAYSARVASAYGNAGEPSSSSPGASPATTVAPIIASTAFSAVSTAYAAASTASSSSTATPSDAGSASSVGVLSANGGTGVPSKK